MSFTLQILYASDLEGGLNALENAANFASLVEHYETAQPNTVLLSAGDNFIPGPFYVAGGDNDMGDVYDTVFNDFYDLTPDATTDDTLAYEDLRAGAGWADIAIMNLIGFDASALGNHEFDAGLGNLLEQVHQYPRGEGLDNDRWIGAQFPYLSTNLDFSDSDFNFVDSLLDNTAFEQLPPEAALVAEKYEDDVDEPSIAASTVITVGGEKIGVVGLTTPYVERISSPGVVTVIDEANTTNADRDTSAENVLAEMTALAAQVQADVDLLQDATNGVDKVILVSHLQDIAYETALAAKLSGVDVIIAGGSETELEDPLAVTDLDGNTVQLVSVPGEYSSLGRLTVTFDDNGLATVDTVNTETIATTDAIAAATSSTATLDDDEITYTDGSKAALVQTVVDAIKDIVTAKDADVAGRSDVFLEGRREIVRTEETNLGNLSTDSMLYATSAYGTNVAIKNSGGIRNYIGSIVDDADNGTTTIGATLANTLSGREAGEVSQLMIEDSMKFNNSLTVIETDGESLVTLLQHGVDGFTDSASTPGQFPQVSGVRLAFSTIDTAATSSLPASRKNTITDVALTDQAGLVTQKIMEDGVFVEGGREATIVLTSLNFLTDNDGDGYPFSTINGFDSKIDTGIGEQSALYDYLESNFALDGYGLEDTSTTFDNRIVQLADRADISNQAPTATKTLALKSVGQFESVGDANGEGGTEIVKVSGQLAVSTNGAQERIDVLDVSNPTEMSLVTSLDVAAMNLSVSDLGGNALADLGGLTSVDISGTTIVASYKNATAGENGFVVVYDYADPADVGARVLSVGSHPDSIVIDSSGEYAFTANEGEIVYTGDDSDEQLADDQYYVDAAGSISMVHLESGTVSTIGFDGFDDSVLETLRLSPAAVAAKGSLAEAALVDIEPEYVTLSADGSTLFVTLQENNAVAKVDLAAWKASDASTVGSSVMELLPLGYKDHSIEGNGLDASDKDDAIDIATFDLKGMYMPDAIAAYAVNGVDYFVIANEGDGRGDLNDEGEKGKYGDEERIKDITLDETAFGGADLVAALQDNSSLGRLKVSLIDGDTDGDGDYDELYSFGARSFSIFNADGDLVFDSGDDFEAITAAISPLTFNSDEGTDNQNRSGAKGPEPESLEIFSMHGKTYAAIGLERMDAMMVYDITNPANAQFVNVLSTRERGDNAPEEIEFLVSDNNAYLMVSNEVSSTIGVHQVLGLETVAGGDDTAVGSAMGDMFVAGAGDNVIAGGEGHDMYLTDGMLSRVSVLRDADIAQLERFKGDIFADGEQVYRVETKSGVDLVSSEEILLANSSLTAANGGLLATESADMIHLGVGEFALDTSGGDDLVRARSGNAVDLGDGDDEIEINLDSSMVAIDTGSGADIVYIIDGSSTASATSIHLDGFTNGSDKIDLTEAPKFASTFAELTIAVDETTGNIEAAGQGGVDKLIFNTVLNNLELVDIDATDFVFAPASDLV